MTELERHETLYEAFRYEVNTLALGAPPEVWEWFETNRVASHLARRCVGHVGDLDRAR